MIPPIHHVKRSLQSSVTGNVSQRGAFVPAWLSTNWKIFHCNQFSPPIPDMRRSFRQTTRHGRVKLCLSIAAWRAVLQYIWNPYRWEKTEHGVAKRAGDQFAGYRFAKRRQRRGQR
jgi:hypothetical protein